VVLTDCLGDLIQTGPFLAHAMSSMSAVNPARWGQADLRWF
jgi:hypothetical protein